MSGTTQATLAEGAAAAEKTYEARAYAASGASSGLAPAAIHSDLSQVRNEWQKTMPTVYSCVPGHEIVGRVMTLGGAVAELAQAPASRALECSPARHFISARRL